MSKLYHAGSTHNAQLSIEEVLTNPPNYEISWYEDVTPQLAKNILSKHKFEKQRPLRNAHVNKLQNAILDGSYSPVSPITFAISERLKVVNVNGQHTLSAIIQAQKTTRLLFNFVPDEAKKAYTVIDNHNKRTVFDALAAIGELDISKKDIQRFGSACKILANFDIKNLEVDPYKIQDVMDLYIDSYNMYKETIINSGAKKGFVSMLFARVPIAIGVALYHHAPNLHNEITEFFYNVVTGDCHPDSIEHSLYEKYLKGRRTSWGAVPSNELKDILAHWRCSVRNLKTAPNHAARLSVWNSTPNLYGTNIKFKDTKIYK